MRNRYLAVGFGAILAAAVVAAVLGSAGLFPTVSGPGQRETLRLAAFEGDVGALTWIAHDKGYFADAGLDVVIKGYASGNAAVDAMRAGEADVATASELVVAKRSFAENDLRIFADICRYWNKGLIGRRDRGVTGPAELTGKRIGVPATSSAEHNLMVFLALHGLSAHQVTIVDLQPKALVESMVAGTIDAAIVWQPHVLTIQQRLGDNAVTLMDGGTEDHLLLITQETILTARSRALTRLLRGVIAAEAWVNSHPGLAKAYLIERFALTADYLAGLWPRMQLAVGLPQEILAAMESEARWIARTTDRTTTPDFTHTIAPALMKAVNPGAVTLFVR